MPIGTRARKYRNSLSEQITLRIRRVRCKCGKIHHELPDILVPYKRYEAACIEKVVSEPKGSATIALDESTICRWKAWFRERIAHWIGGLVSIAIRFKLPVEDKRKAIQKHGAPESVYVDNGKQYRTKWMHRAP